MDGERVNVGCTLNPGSKVNKSRSVRTTDNSERTIPARGCLQGSNEWILEPPGDDTKVKLPLLQIHNSTSTTGSVDDVIRRSTFDWRTPISISADDVQLSRPRELPHITGYGTTPMLCAGPPSQFVPERTSLRAQASGGRTCRSQKACIVEIQ